MFQELNYFIHLSAVCRSCCGHNAMFFFNVVSTGVHRYKMQKKEDDSQALLLCSRNVFMRFCAKTEPGPERKVYNEQCLTVSPSCLCGKIRKPEMHNAQRAREDKFPQRSGAGFGQALLRH